MEIERFLHHGLIGRNGLPEEVLVRRKALARGEIEHFVKLLEQPPMGVQVGIVTDTLPQTGFQIFRQPDREIARAEPVPPRWRAQCPCRSGDDYISSGCSRFSEASVDEMWGRALKGQTAANLVRHLLANKGQPLDGENFADVRAGAKRGARTNLRLSCSR